MSLIQRNLDAALHPPVKRKRNSTGGLRSKAARVARGAPEVMVKVTGFSSGAKHVYAHFTYISRHGKLELENDRGEIFRGKEDVGVLFEDWKADFNSVRSNQRDTAHLMLSMPPGTEPEAVRAAVRHFTKQEFGRNHEYVFALHTDQAHPHCHVTVKCLGFDGRRLNPRKADLHAWREGFAQAMREEGYDAEATPRRSRGVVRKAVKSVIWHMEHGDKTHAPRVPKVRALQVRQAAEELMSAEAGQPTKPRPWDEKIKVRQASIRQAWLDASKALDALLTPILYKQEPRNERPDYSRSSAGRISDKKRIHAAARPVHQPGTPKLATFQPARFFASMRNLPGFDVVYHPRAAEMLLQPHAYVRVGQLRGVPANHDLRRKGNRVNGYAVQPGRLDDGRMIDFSGKELAQKIRELVKNMPDVETQRDQIEKALQTQFTMAADHGVTERLPTSNPGHSKKGPER